MIPKAILDAGIIIGARHSRDQYNKDAVHIMKDFGDRSIRTLYITQFVLAECVAFLLNKVGFEKANATFQYLTETENIELVQINDIERMKELFQKYQNLSLADCSLIVLSEERNIKTLFSFDKHFDAVKGLRRLTIAK